MRNYEDVRAQLRSRSRTWAVTGAAGFIGLARAIDWYAAKAPAQRSQNAGAPGSSRGINGALRSHT